MFQIIKHHKLEILYYTHKLTKVIMHHH